MSSSIHLFRLPLLAVVMVALQSSLIGQSLVLNPEFGTGGSIELPAEKSAAAFVELENGQFYALGTADVGPGPSFTKYLPDGSVDSSFGDNGSANIPEELIFFIDLKVQPDGKMVVSAIQDRAENEPPGPQIPKVLRFNSDGSVDTDFGTNGQVVLEQFQVILAIIIQPDGKILAGGFSADDLPRLLVTRLNSDGSLDAGFGTGGNVVTDTGNPDVDQLFRRMILQPDGKILIQGDDYSKGGFDPSPILARHNADGTPDTSFGNNGFIIHGLESEPEWVIVAASLQSDGKILLGGFLRFAPFDPNNRGLLIRLNPDGQLDDSFGAEGILVSDKFVVARNFFPQSDGSTLIRDFDPDVPELRFLKLTMDGELDSEFGTEGILVNNQIGSITAIIQLTNSQFLIGEEPNFFTDPPEPGFLHQLVINTDPPLIDDYEEWLQRHFTGEDLNNETIVAREADPDGDKLTNEFEFEANIVPNDSTSILVAKVDTPGGEKLCVGPILSGVPVSVETSGDMNAWEELIRIEPSVIRREKVEVDLPSPSEGRRFYRARPVRVTTSGS